MNYDFERIGELKKQCAVDPVRAAYKMKDLHQQLEQKQSILDPVIQKLRYDIASMHETNKRLLNIIDHLTYDNRRLKKNLAEAYVTEVGND